MGRVNWQMEHSLIGNLGKSMGPTATGSGGIGSRARAAKYACSASMLLSSSFSLLLLSSSSPAWCWSNASMLWIDGPNAHYFR